MRSKHSLVRRREIDIQGAEEEEDLGEDVVGKDGVECLGCLMQKVK